MVDCDGVDGGHETLLDAVGVVENLSNWGEAVGCAGSVRHDLHAWVILVAVDTLHENWGAILGRSRDNSLLGSTLEMCADLLFVHEDTGALSNIVSSDGAPRDLGWVSLLEHVDLLSIDKDATISLLDSSLESAYSERNMRHGL